MYCIMYIVGPCKHGNEPSGSVKSSRVSIPAKLGVLNLWLFCSREQKETVPYTNTNVVSFLDLCPLGNYLIFAASEHFLYKETLRLFKV
jgi:hypothetical protein